MDRSHMTDIFVKSFAASKIAEPGIHVFLDGKTTVVNFSSVCFEKYLPTFNHAEFMADWNQEMDWRTL